MPGGPDPALLAAYTECRRVHRRHDPTYYLATRRLPSQVRPAVHALYAFVRTADELVDGPGRPADPAARSAALDRCQGELERALSGEPSSDPTVTALVDAGSRHGLPLGELGAYFDSMRVDCSPVRMESWEELERYMLGSAGTVGRILASLLDAPPERHEAFVRLALAFQLTNFIRDVREDWQLDRVYLPREDRDRFGVTVEQIARREVTPGFREMLALEVGRARELFRDGEEASQGLPSDVRRGMRMARAVYLGVLDRAERLGFDVLRRRASLPPWELAGAVAGGLRHGA
ncbi:MAG TPA: phytoene/squalene synthase family protein [Thermoleophilaceae bacterium]|nr:phytoene/squalene synthase family protein [Thermoleophilaceae bacterium]